MTSDPPSEPRSLTLPGPDIGQLEVLSPSTPSTPPNLNGPRTGAHPLASKVTTVLSASYADSEFREALAQLDDRLVQNAPETRRQLRLDLQKEVIDSNGEIINEFGKVAEVSPVFSDALSLGLLLTGERSNCAGSARQFRL